MLSALEIFLGYALYKFTFYFTLLYFHKTTDKTPNACTEFAISNIKAYVVSA